MEKIRILEMLMLECRKGVFHIIAWNSFVIVELKIIYENNSIDAATFVKISVLSQSS